MNRKRVLWPLLLVGAFALGVLVAQVQAGTIFLPLVARASTGTVSVENVHWQWRDRKYYGELVNETSSTVSASRVAMYLLDGEGLPVASAMGYSMAPLLSPGERTPFVVRWYDPLPEWESYVIYPEWDPVDRLTVESALRSSGKSGWWIMTATVHNQLPVRVESVAVGMVVYGSSGEVIGYDGPREVLGPLDPGDTLEVSHNFYWYDWEDEDEPVSCAAFAVPSEGL